MQLQQPYDTLEPLQKRPIADPPAIRTRTDAFAVIDGVKQSIRRLSIKQKIGYGYAVAISIAVIGTGSGLLVGDYYQQKAKAQLSQAHEQQSLLTELQHQVLTARSQQQHLVPLVENSIQLKAETRNFLETMQRVGTLLGILQAFTDSNASTFIILDEPEIVELWNAYAAIAASYSDWVEEPNAAHLSSSDRHEPLAPSEKQLLVSQMRQIETQLEQLSQKLNHSIETAKIQDKLANRTFDTAQSLRWKLTVLGMMLSVTIAAVLAYYTSRAIARPIEWVTQVAQRATDRSNYKLRAPILTEDEAGLLAASLNQLIERVEKQIQEIQQTQAQLIQTEKMSSLGQLVAGIAHEINNPVNFITGNIEHTNHYVQDLLELVMFYQKEYPHPTEPIQELIDDIDLEFVMADLPKLLSSMTIGADRIRQIVLSLRNFSRLDEAEKKRVNLHEGINSTLLLLNHRLYPEIETIEQYGDLPEIECYPAQLNQVFMHLISNAIDALESWVPNRSCAPRIHSALVPSHSVFVSSHLSFVHRHSSTIPNPGQLKNSLEQLTPDKPQKTIRIRTERKREWIEISISDNGPGIAPENRRKLFDPFFTTKPPGKGTGLGLAISYQILEKHGGKIEVKSEFGKGSEFLISLPIHTAIESL